MSVADVFNNFARGVFGNNQGGNNQSTAPTPATGVTTNPTVPSGNDGIPPNPIAAFPDNKGTETKSPLETYSELFITKPTDTLPPTLAPNFTVDPAAIATAVGKIDFTKALDPAQLALASKGDATALAGIINQTAQVSLTQAMTATGNIVRDALTKQANDFKDTVMPDILRRHEISMGNKEGNSLYNSPAVAPMFKIVEERMTQRFPQASPAEITKHTQTYFDGMASEILKSRGYTVESAPATSSGSKANNINGTQTDWDSWMSS